MKFTVGMATYDDFDGFYFTANSLLTHHRDYVNEIVVVENDKLDKDGESRLKEYCKKNNKIKYVNFPTPIGTAAPRNAVFDNASNKHVVCVDSHILVVPDGFKHLVEFYEKNPGCVNDLVQGPLLMDNLSQVSTQFSEKWGSGMKGQWHTDHEVFPMVDFEVNGRKFKTTALDSFGVPIYVRPWFEIPAMGLGLFACTKEGWLRFNDNFRGFGGEEWYIHDKYRKAGRKCWSVSGLMWVHRFRPKGKFSENNTHAAKTTDKFRNYIIGWQENEKDLQEVIDHFHGNYEAVINSKFITSVFDELGIKDFDIGKSLELAKKNHEASKSDDNCPPCQKKVKEQRKKIMDNPPDVKSWVRGLTSSSEVFKRYNEAVGELKNIKSILQVKGHIGVSAPIFAANHSSVKFNFLRDTVPSDFEMFKKILGGTELNFTTNSGISNDVVILNADDVNNEFSNDLAHYNNLANKYLIVTSIKQGSDNFKHLLSFLKHNPQFVAKHEDLDDKSYSIVILSKDKSDAKSRPGLITLAWNFSKFQAQHLMSDKRVVLPQVAEERLNSCMTCPNRTNHINDDNELSHVCSSCGCYLEAFKEMGMEAPGKVWYAESECPVHRWGKEKEESRLVPLHVPTINAQTPVNGVKELVEDSGGENTSIKNKAFKWLGIK